jgi:hypothetical protein
MVDRSLAAHDVMAALEAFGPQARPHNADDLFDCWGLVRQIHTHLLGRGHAEELLGPKTAKSGDWRPLGDRADLVVGDVVGTHPCSTPDERHVALYCGRVGDNHLVYDSSPRGDIPLLDKYGDLIGVREIFTRYMRATASTHGLRNQGGGYLRLWDGRDLYFSQAAHRLLLLGAPERERDTRAARVAAGLELLPFYCRRRLPRDARGREVYDNSSSKHQQYYVPDAALLRDGLYERVCEQGEVDVLAARPRPPAFDADAGRAAPGGGRAFTWTYGDADVGGCRVDVYEETPDGQKRLVLREELPGPVTAFTVPGRVLREDNLYAFVVFARNGRGYSRDAVSTFVYRAAPGSPLLDHNRARPYSLQPDDGAVVATLTPTLAWQIARPEADQVRFRLEFYAGACREQDSRPLYEVTVEGAAALSCRYKVPPLAGLEPGGMYYWYVTSTNARGRDCYAPAEGVFVVAADADAGGMGAEGRA